MKKILLSLIVILLPFCLKAQTGNGTSSSPYYGSITSSVTWNAGDFTNGTVYIGTSRNPKLTIASAGTLTINSGVTLVFYQTTALLEVIGSLIVNGTLASPVTFTKDPGKANWGNVFFNTTAGDCSLNYCIIENGKGTAAAPDGGGMSFYNVTSDILISNTIIRNCAIRADGNFGGGIEIVDSDIDFENCLIYDNYGAGIDVSGGSSTITNCTIVGNNNPNSGEAGGIFVYSGSPVILNTILWNNTQGSTQEQDFINLDAASISYCAATQTISGTGMVDLHPTNDNAAGPNFVNPSSDNYDITYLSPCADAGTTGGPSTDFSGNTRVGNSDIGAYENLDFIWQGDDGSTPTNWGTAANWNKNVIPTASGRVVIPDVTNDPTVNSDPSSPAICATMTINSGGALTIAAGKALTVVGNLANNGSLTLKSSSSGTATMIIDSYSGTGTSNYEIYLTGRAYDPDTDNSQWHYITPPVSSVSASIFTVNTLDLAQYDEGRPSGLLSEGWVAYDGYVYSTGLSNGPTFSTLTAGKGYNYWDDQNRTYTMSGSPITSDVTLNLTYGSNQLPGFNLVGNPFTAGIDWDDIIGGTYFSYPSNTSQSLFFTRDNVPCSYINGVGVPEDVTSVIPPMQGFFVKTNSSGNTITLPADARTHTNVHARYKGSNNIPLIRLKLVRNNENSDETVVRFDNKAESSYDLYYDAIKMSSSNKKTLIYSVMSGVRYSINGQPFPESSLDIPLNINIAKDTIHVISATRLIGLENYNITLKDLSNGFTADLRTNPSYSFSAPAGTLSGRFVLNVSLKTTGIETPQAGKNLFNIYSGNGNINIQTLVDEWDGKLGDVRIMDLTGRIIATEDNAEFTRNSLVRVPIDNRTGIYMVEIKSGLMRHTAKVVVR